MSVKTKITLITALALIFAASAISPIFAHCEIPCGIYGDRMRFAEMREHIRTIEKSTKEIISLSKKESTPLRNNQLVRWVVNKDEHVKKLYYIVQEYFLHQRIKPVKMSDAKAYKEYTHKLVLLHQITYYGMKAKQTTDLKHVKKLRELVDDFEKAYFGKMEKSGHHH